MQNTIILPVPLAKNTSLNVNSNISIYLYKESRRLLAPILIQLTAKELVVDPSGGFISIKTNVPDVGDLSSYTVKVDFASGLLIS